MTTVTAVMYSFLFIHKNGVFHAQAGVFLFFCDYSYGEQHFRFTMYRGINYTARRRDVYRVLCMCSSALPFHLDRIRCIDYCIFRNSTCKTTFLTKSQPRLHSYDILQICVEFVSCLSTSFTTCLDLFLPFVPFVSQLAKKPEAVMTSTAQLTHLLQNNQ